MTKYCGDIRKAGWNSVTNVWFQMLIIFEVEVWRKLVFAEFNNTFQKS